MHIDLEQRIYSKHGDVPHAFFQKDGVEIDMGLRSLERVETILSTLLEKGYIQEEKRNQLLTKASSFGIYKKISDEQTEVEHPAKYKSPEIDKEEYVLGHLLRKTTPSL